MDDDAEMEAIRQRRMAELQGGRGGGQQAAENEQRQREMEERRRTILANVLTPEARERLSRIHLVKPEKARGVEDLVINAAQRGQLREKVDEQHLISLLEQLSQKEAKPKITIQRKKRLDDDY